MRSKDKLIRLQLYHTECLLLFVTMASTNVRMSSIDATKTVHLLNKSSRITVVLDIAL